MLPLPIMNAALRRQSKGHIIPPAAVFAAQAGTPLRLNRDGAQMLRRNPSVFKALCLRTLAGLALLCSLAAAQAQTATPNADQVRARYTKYEYRVPMRDGVRLFTAVYVPKDASQRYPFLLTRTP